MEVGQDPDILTAQVKFTNDNSVTDASLPGAVAVADSWRGVKKAELVENTNSRWRFLFHLVWRGHGKELPWGLGQWGSGQLATCGKKEGLIYI